MALPRFDAKPELPLVSDATISVARAVAAARDERASLRVSGAGTWLDAGQPVAHGRSLSLAGDSGIVEYQPGDLTLTARAGTTLAELYRATAANGQWLPLDPWGGDDGTLGATASTASRGPHSFSMGLPRDVILGLECVTGAGDTVRAGGRVVKNVAGFDLTRLMIGSWGTLAVITELTVRLRARPDVVRSVQLGVRDDRASLNELAIALRSLPFTPMAAELLSDNLAGALGLASRPTLIARIGGNAKSVAAQIDELRRFGALEDLDGPIWHRLRRSERPEAASWRVSNLPALFGDTWEAARISSAELDAWMSGNPATGMVRVSATGSAGVLARAAAVKNATVIVEKLPADAWAQASRREQRALDLRIRAVFDPDGILNPGIVGSA